MARRRPFNPDAMSADPGKKASAGQPGLFEKPNAKRAADKPRSAGDAPITVTQLVRRIKSAVNQHLPATIHLIGEIGDLSRPASGHVYLTLKDADCTIQAVMWKSAAAKLKFALNNGLEIVATGTVDVYESGGRVQFYVRKIQPRGTGALELAFRQLHDNLKREGLFDPQRKRALPPVPQRIGLVTSPTGAAIRDIIHTIRKRYPPVALILYPVRVQGDGSAKEIAEAIDRLNRWSGQLGGIDVLIIGRGGGSLEDLWAFNEESVARAIERSRIPIISAVGHEIDITISDLVADVRAPTPTAAGQLAVPDRVELAKLLDARGATLSRAVQHTLELADARTSRLEQDTLFRRPEIMVHHCSQRLDEMATRLHRAPLGQLTSSGRRIESFRAKLSEIQPARTVANGRRKLSELERRLRARPADRFLRLERRLAELHGFLTRVGPIRRIDRADETLRQLAIRIVRAAAQHLDRLDGRLVAMHERLEASSHHSVLRRGFSLTRDANTGKILRAASEVRPGDLIRSQLHDGVIDSRVEAPGIQK